MYSDMSMNHGALVVEEKFGKGGRVRFADAGWARKINDPIGRLDRSSGARTADGVGDAFERGVLSMTRSRSGLPY